MLRTLYANLKKLLLIVACAYAIVVCVRNELTARRETSPTSIDIANFTRDYHGQQWLSLTGQLDWDQTRTDSGDTWVALVDPDAGPSDPVHVFISADPAQLPREKLVTVTGLQIFFDPAQLFPHVRRGEPFIMLQADSRPDRPGLNLKIAIFFSAVLLFTVSTLVRNVLTARRPREMSQATAD